MIALNIMTIFSQLSYAVNATSEEMDSARQWASAKFVAKIPQVRRFRSSMGGNLPMSSVVVSRE